MRRADVEARMTQEASRLRVQEDVLRDALKKETELRGTARTRQKEVELELNERRGANEDMQRKIEAKKKSLNLLKMRISDLRKQVDENSSNERKTTQTYHEHNTTVRELERELFDLNIESERMKDELESKMEKKQRLFMETEEVKDRCLRESQRADVQRIALEQSLKHQAMEKHPLDTKYQDILQEYADTKAEMSTQQDVHDQTKIEYEKRIYDEEAANNQLVQDIAMKATSETELAADLAEETDAKDVLLRQIEDQDQLCLELGKRLHRLESAFVVMSEELKAKDLECVELVQETETITSDSQVMAAKLETEQESTRKLTQWAQKERVAMERLESKLETLRSNEAAHNLAVKQDEADTERMKFKLDDLTRLIKTTKADMHEALAEVDFKKEKLDELSGVLKHDTSRFSKIAIAVDKIQRELTERTSAFEKKHKMFTMAKNDLEGKIGEKDDEIQRLGSILKKSDGEVANMQGMMEEAAETAERTRLELDSKIVGLMEMNEDLRVEMRTQHDRNARLAEDIGTTKTRCGNASKRMSANETKAAEIARLNADEMDELTRRLQQEAEKVHDLEAALSKDTNELTRLQAEFDAIDHEKRRYQTGVRDEKHDADEISRKLEDNKEEELDRLKRIEDQEGERDRLTAHDEEKDDMLYDLKTAVTKNSNAVDTMKKSLHDAEVREADMYSQQSIDQSKIADLETELKAQEEQHVQDANAVKLKIIQLQDALQEKIHTVNKLEKAVASMKAHGLSLQMRLEQTESESSHCQRSYENMLDEEQGGIASVRNEVEKLTRELVHLRQIHLKKEELVADLNVKINEMKSENETMLAEAYRKDRQAHNSEIGVQRLTIREREMLETIDDLQETSVELRLQSRNGEHNEQDLRRLLNELNSENKVMRHQIAEKMKTERVLLLELEASRHHINDATGHALAEKRAEIAVEELLHENNDDGATMVIEDK